MKIVDKMLNELKNRLYENKIDISFLILECLVILDEFFVGLGIQIKEEGTAWCYLHLVRCGVEKEWGERQFNFLSLLLGGATELSIDRIRQDEALALVSQPLFLAAKQMRCHPVRQRLSDVPVAGLYDEVCRTIHHHHRDGISIRSGIDCQHLLHGHVKPDVQLIHVLDALVGRSLVVVVEGLHDVEETTPRIGV